MSTRKRPTPPEEVRKINAHAREFPCQDCAAAPGEPCAKPGRGRTVHKTRYIAAAIALKHADKAGRRTPEQDAVLAGLPRVPRAEIEAARTPAGGWNRATLARWGVPWPPPAGWKQALEREAQ